jgi:trimeric autotransporter adhesin
VHSVKLSWTAPAEASSFDLYMSSARGCDIAIYTSCPDGAVFKNVTSPHTVENLRNGQPYFFRIDSASSAGAHGTSNEAGARPNGLSFNGEVRAAVTGADGRVYIGGGFTKAGIATGSAVPLDMSTGRLASADFPMVAGEVRAVAADGAGGWYVGGQFTYVGGIARKNLAHILANGTVDPSFHPDPNNVVYALAVARGVVYVGGSFKSLASAPSHARLVAIRADGTVDQNFRPLANNIVYALAISGTTLYVGSGPSPLGSPTDPFLLAVNTLDAVTHAGEQQSWNPGINGMVRALAVAEGTVYAGGTFTKPRGRLAAIDAMDSSKIDQAYPQPPRIVTALAAAGHTLYVGGNALSLLARDGTVRNGLAVITPDLSIDERYPDTEYDVLALAATDSTLFVGSRLRPLNAGPPAQRPVLAALNTADGDKHPGEPLDWQPDINGEALALAVSGNTVYAAGNFGALGGTTRNHLAALDTNGALLPWNPDANQFVLALAVTDDTVYAGGGFTTLGGQPQRFLAAIGKDGVIDRDFHPNPDNVVRGLTAARGTVYAGGNFKKIGDASRNGLAAIRANGTLESFQPLIAGNVHAVTILGTTLYVGGGFESIDGDTAHHHLVAFNTLDASSKPGELVAGWTPGLANPEGGSTFVNALAVSGNTVYAGGNFTAPRGGFVALDAATATVNENYPQALGEVWSLAVSGNTLYVGGISLQLKDKNGGNHNCLAAIDADGTLDERYPDADSFVTALAPTQAGLFVAGYFSAIGGQARAFFSKLNADGTVE